MSKLTLDALKERASEIASDQLMNSISGGLENACHDTYEVPDEREEGTTTCDRI